MKRFIRKIIVYTQLIVLFFSVFTWLCIKGLRQSEFGNLKEWKEILEGRVNAEVLVHGSSRARVHFDTHLIDSILGVNSYNAGMDGAPFDIQYIRWKAYLANNRPPQVIFQQVDLDLLDRNEQVFQKYQYIPFQYDPDLRPWLIRFGILDKADRYVPFSVLMGQPQAIRLGLESISGYNRHPSARYKGFEAHTGEWQGSRPDDTASRKARKWIVDADLLTLFEQYIEECKALNIRLVLVYSPMYRAIDTMVEDFQSSAELYRRLAATHSIEFYDFSSTELSHNPSNFYNTTHLNKTGATAFTRRLLEVSRRGNTVASE